jgi:hypothetical protein
MYAQSATRGESPEKAVHSSHVGMCFGVTGRFNPWDKEAVQAALGIRKNITSREEVRDKLRLIVARDEDTELAEESKNKHTLSFYVRDYIGDGCYEYCFWFEFIEEAKFDTVVITRCALQGVRREQGKKTH